MKTFDTMKTYVGTFIGDTTGSFKTLIGQDINEVYEDVWRRIEWNVCIDDTNTFESVADTATVALPADFEKELYVTNIATGEKLQPMKPAEWWREESDEYTDDSIDSGKSNMYVILREDDVIKLFPTPDKAETYALPYKKTFTALSADSDTVAIQGIDPIIEYGTLAKDFERKQLYSKASYYLEKFEITLARRIVQERNTSNYKYQSVPPRRWYGKRIQYLTGENSYGTV